MKNALLLIIFLLTLAHPMASQTPADWVRISGPPGIVSGQPDGVSGDRANSYAWSMEMMGDGLYVGTNRNIFSMMVAMAGIPWPAVVPMPRVPDPGPAIYRMDSRTHQWTMVYQSQSDVGYRMMKSFRGRPGGEVLYVGSAGFQSCRLLAVESSGSVTEVFRSPMRSAISSIRAITQHDGRLYWAADTAGQPGIWHSSSPLEDHRAGRAFSPLPKPDPSIIPARAEVADMISAYGWLYVYYIAHPTIPGPPFLEGFWSIKGRWMGNRWVWQPVVGNHPGAKYQAGIDSPLNGAAAPFRFRDHVYVGTLDGTTFRMMTGLGGSSLPGPPVGGPLNPEMIINIMGGRHGMRIYRFDATDRYEPVMPGGQGDAAAEGFGSALNKYIWRFGEQNGVLYAGTFDISTGVDVLSAGAFQDPVVRGFDLCSTRDGMRWTCESRNGFDDPFNYGVRSFVSDARQGVLYMGTANPFYGCQIWMRKPGKSSQN